MTKEEKDLNDGFKEDQEYLRAEQAFLSALPRKLSQDQIQLHHKEWKLSYITQWN